ncbi:Predicted arabinose efflux permease, MFS family [Enhydrobacter aerosaccus]|uniref:Predicted arabinose efflux permease, MFS family n=1 Tax=Enhydrobacter aerosaccus TaxID=225324 RepID=A0A1T4NI43_9HYPH|nr:MFS transporter [Enhydrobacter aerosaccus]SJZ78727.1 Predicted arabinose efflux permease, MFS family [Enhydrobacter aerosaccus]
MSDIESRYAWWRLAASVALSTLGGVGMWAVVVALPPVQADFGVTRADVSFSYTATMVGFGIGSILLGRLIDAKGALLTVTLSTVVLAAGFAVASYAPTALLFALAHILIGFGSAATFVPLVADLSHWFDKRRGLAVAICSAGNYVAGALWPPIVEHLVSHEGWRSTYFTIGIICLVAMLPLGFALRRRLVQDPSASGGMPAAHSARSLGLSPAALQAWLALAGIGCCVAMSMPQVHIVAYCADLGYGVARGAEMLSLMLGFGIVSRVASGWIADRVGGIKTLLLGSTLQAVALFLYLISDTLTSLYVVSALFGLFQGGIVPSYAIIVREYFPSREAGIRMGIAVSATIVGMALGGWMGGVFFDLSGSYRAAFINGIAWNALNGAIAWWLLLRQTRRAVFVT